MTKITVISHVSFYSNVSGSRLSSISIFCYIVILQFKLVECMDDQFVLINTCSNNLTKIKEVTGSVVITQYSGLNTDVFVLTKNEQRLKFAFFKVNSRFYLCLNEDHIVDYHKFLFIDKMVQDNNDVLIHNNVVGNIKLTNCDIEMVKKSISIMNDYAKPKRNFIKEFLEYILT